MCAFGFFQSLGLDFVCISSNSRWQIIKRNTQQWSGSQDYCALDKFCNSRMFPGHA